MKAALDVWWFKTICRFIVRRKLIVRILHIHASKPYMGNSKKFTTDDSVLLARRLCEILGIEYDTPEDQPRRDWRGYY